MHKNEVNMRLDQSGIWYQLIICPEHLHESLWWIDGDTGIPAYVGIDDRSKSWHCAWWDNRRERISKRISELLLRN